MLKRPNKYTWLCPLCSGKKYIYYKFNERTYYQCEKCAGISLDESDHLSPEEEMKRYLEHNNDVKDIKYQNFVKPIILAICNDFSRHNKGLDYGAGTGPVITKILTDNSYNIKTYDPYFHNFPDYLKKKYDYIACCEVIEHFYRPYHEFRKLKNLLNKNGALYCQTDLYKDNIDFKNWYYKNDPTHVFFYTEKTVCWIKERFKFKEGIVKNRLITFRN